MIKNPLSNHVSHSSQYQKHSSAIISIDQKYSTSKKPHLSKNYLSPQQKNNILQNGPLILQFIQDKLNIINEINYCNDNMLIENCTDNKFKHQIQRIEQSVNFIQKGISLTIEHELNGNKTCSELNETIYSLLNELSQVQSEILQKLNTSNSIKEIKINSTDATDDQKLKQYFYSFLISMAATQHHYNQFLESIYDQLFFNAQFSPQKVQTAMIQDSQYCVKILIIALMNKFNKIVNNYKFTSNLHLVYFPNQDNFLKLTLKFILINLNQVTDKINGFTSKYRQLHTLIQKNKYQQDQKQTEENLKNTLSRYLPQQFQVKSNNFSQHTFSPRDLQYLKNNMLRSYNIKSHLDQWSTALNILETKFFKICFNRILKCKRHNFYATQAIFNTVSNFKIHKLLVFNGFKEIFHFFETTKHYTNRESLAEIDFNKKLLKKILINWKCIKQRKETLLRQLIKKKTKAQKKGQTFLFNLWRINISRMRISEKILAHSSSCSAVLNKFTDEEIEKFEQKKQKNSEQLQKSLRKMSGITLKKSTSFRSGLSQSRMTNNSKPKNSNISQKPINPDLKLLNYQYKQSIMEKLNKKTRRNNDNSKQIPSKTSAILQSKTLLKVQTIY